MRTPITYQIKELLTKSARESLYVYKKDEIKRWIYEFLIENNMIFSPCKNILVIKKSTESVNEAIKKNIIQIIEKIEWASLTGKSAVDILNWKWIISKKIEMIHPKKFYTISLWNPEIYKISIKKRKAATIYTSTNFQNCVLTIESDLSLIINNINDFIKEGKTQRFMLSRSFEEDEIIQWLFSKLKLSGLSKLALFYKENNRDGQYRIIKRIIEESWKKLDRRWIKKEIELHKKTNVRKRLVNDLDNLISVQ